MIIMMTSHRVWLVFQFLFFSQLLGLSIVLVVLSSSLSFFLLLVLFSSSFSPCSSESDGSNSKKKPIPRSLGSRRLLPAWSVAHTKKQKGERKRKRRKRTKKKKKSKSKIPTHPFRRYPDMILESSEEDIRDIL